METENTGKKKQRRSTASERAEVLEQFRRSGLTRIAFSRDRGIALSTLGKWLTNAKRKSKTSTPVLFRELKVSQAPTVSAMPWAIEIVGPGGLLIRCREPFCANDLVRLLRGWGC